MEVDVARRQRFEAVVDVVYEPLQRYFGRRTQPADVSELLDDSLLVVWRRLEDVPLDDPLPWCYGVARRCLANHRRGTQRRLRLVKKVAASASRIHADPDTRDLEVQDPKLAAAMAALSEAERELVRLWAWEGLEPKEIALVLETTANAVSLRLSRTKKKILSSLERQDVDAAGQEGFRHTREASP